MENSCKKMYTFYLPTVYCSEVKSVHFLLIGFKKQKRNKKRDSKNNSYFGTVPKCKLINFDIC